MTQPKTVLITFKFEAVEMFLGSLFSSEFSVEEDVLSILGKFGKWTEAVLCNAIVEGRLREDVRDTLYIADGLPSEALSDIFNQFYKHYSGVYVEFFTFMLTYPVVIGDIEVVYEPTLDPSTVSIAYILTPSQDIDKSGTDNAGIGEVLSK